MGFRRKSTVRGMDGGRAVTNGSNGGRGMGLTAKLVTAKAQRTRRGPQKWGETRQEDRLSNTVVTVGRNGQGTNNRGTTSEDACPTGARLINGVNGGGDGQQ